MNLEIGDIKGKSIEMISIGEHPYLDIDLINITFTDHDEIMQIFWPRGHDLMSSCISIGGKSL